MDKGKDDLARLESLMKSERMFINPDAWNEYMERAMKDPQFQKALNAFMYSYFIQNYHWKKKWFAYSSIWKIWYLITPMKISERMLNKMQIIFVIIKQLIEIKVLIGHVTDHPCSQTLGSHGRFPHHFWRTWAQAQDDHWCIQKRQRYQTMEW